MLVGVLCHPLLSALSTVTIQAPHTSCDWLSDTRVTQSQGGGEGGGNPTLLHRATQYYLLPGVYCARLGVITTDVEESGQDALNYLDL